MPRSSTPGRLPSVRRLVVPRSLIATDLPYQPEPGESIDMDALRLDIRRCSALPVSMPGASSFEPLVVLDEEMQHDLVMLEEEASSPAGLAALLERDGA